MLFNVYSAPSRIIIFFLSCLSLWSVSTWIWIGSLLVLNWDNYLVVYCLAVYFWVVFANNSNMGKLRTLTLSLITRPFHSCIFHVSKAHGRHHQGALPTDGPWPPWITFAAVSVKFPRPFPFTSWKLSRVGSSPGSTSPFVPVWISISLSSQLFQPKSSTSSLRHQASQYSFSLQTVCYIFLFALFILIPCKPEHEWPLINVWQSQ